VYCAGEPAPLSLFPQHMHPLCADGKSRSTAAPAPRWGTITRPPLSRDDLVIPRCYAPGDLHQELAMGAVFWDFPMRGASRPSSAEDEAEERASREECQRLIEAAGDQGEDEAPRRVGTRLSASSAQSPPPYLPGRPGRSLHRVTSQVPR